MSQAVQETSLEINSLRWCTNRAQKEWAIQIFKVSKLRILQICKTTKAPQNAYIFQGKKDQAICRILKIQQEAGNMA